MYVPEHFEQKRLAEMHALMAAHPLALVVTAGGAGLEASHVPLLLDAEAGVLRGHLARANPHASAALAGCEVLVIFSGENQYISPSWYPTKAEHGMVVPTWNYVAVHVSGRMWAMAEDLLPQHLRQLTDAHEKGRPDPWSVDDAPAKYLEGLRRAIVGIEIAVERMEGKWKVSQNRPAADRAAVAERMEGIGTESSVTMAKQIRAAKS